MVQTEHKQQAIPTMINLQALVSLKLGSWCGDANRLHIDAIEDRIFERADGDVIVAECRNIPFFVTIHLDNGLQDTTMIVTSGPNTHQQSTNQSVVLNAAACCYKVFARDDCTTAKMLTQILQRHLPWGVLNGDLLSTSDQRICATEGNGCTCDRNRFSTVDYQIACNGNLP